MLAGRVTHPWTHGLAMLARIALLLALLCGLRAPAHALALGDADSGRNLAMNVELLEDPGGRLTLDDVRPGGKSPAFRPWGRAEDVNLGFSRSVWWVRVTLSRTEDAPRNWLLQVPYAYNRQVDFHAPGQPMVETGSDRPISSRPVFHPTLVFPIRLEEKPAQFYFRIQSSYAISVPLVAWEPVDFFKRSLIYFFFQALYYGASLALIAYNLFLALSLRDRRFHWYAGFVSLMALGIFAGNGLGRLFLWPDSPGFDTVASTFFVTLGTMLLVVFSLQFMQTRSYARRVAWSLYGMLALFGALAALQLAALRLPILLAPTLQALTVAGIVLSALLATAGYRAVRARVYGIGYFIAAWSALWIGALVAALRLFDLVPTNTWTSYALQISTAIEMALFAFALAEIVKLERRERMAAQADSLHAKQELVNVMRSQEERLERTIHERTRQLEEALDSEKRILAQYIRFGSLISHELRNPLGTINSQATLMLKEERLTPTGTDRANIIRSAVRRLTKLFDKWLEGDQIRTLSDADLSIVPVDAMEWLRDFLVAHPHFSKSHPIELVEPPRPVTLWADPDLLEIAVSNLVENACKYSEPGSPVRVSAIDEDGCTGIAVADQGLGIAQAQHGEIFEDFSRVAESPQPGLGLGLSFVRRIMQAHRGTVALSSTPEIGSTFRLLFPLNDETLRAHHG